MVGSLGACAEVAAPICHHLADRWRAAESQTDVCARRNLEMAMIVVLDLIAAGDATAERILRRAAASLDSKTGLGTE